LGAHESCVPKFYMSFVATDRAFQIDGKDIFLLSGEVHYFRVPRRLWGTHLRQLKASHCHAVTTYIPWGWHEAQEGKFDFTGKTHPQRDLVGFFREAKKAGLYLIVKPGPYILAEFVAQGLPEWLMVKHPEIVCRDAEGNVIEEAMLTYMHPTFLSYTAKWYDKVMPLIVKNLITNGGPIVMMQVCNEVGLNQWLCGKGDCSPTGLEYFYRFLKETYGTIERLNGILGSSHDSFDQVKPPSGMAKSRESYVLYRLWHRYHRWYYSIYLDHVIREIRTRGVDCPLYHNVPGWVYGRAKHFPQNITVYDEVVKKNPDLLLAVDHIPENPGYRNFHDDLPCNDFVRSLRQGKGPVFAAELQAGTREFCVRTYPDELDLFYKACLAHGLQGMNFYMFSQGRNPMAKGHFGPTFYWETALSTEGKKLPLYPKIANLGRWLKSHGRHLVNTSRRSRVAAGLYAPLYQTEFTHPLWGNHRLDFGSIGMQYDPQAIRDAILFDGVIKAAQYLNIDMDTVDLQTQTVEELLEYKQLWVAIGEWMDSGTQRKLEQYVRLGGHLILAPNVPWLDENLLPCTVLQDALKLRRDSLRTYSCPKITLLGDEDLNAFGKIQTFHGTGKTFAKTMEGKPCGVQISLGKGRASVLGTGLPNVISEHFDAYQRLFALDKIRPHAWCDARDVRVVERFGKGYAYLFVLNYHKTDFRAAIHYTDPVSGRVKKLPTKGAMRIGACSASIYPLNLPLSKGKRGIAEIAT
jgi:beta-galactosidase